MARRSSQRPVDFEALMAIVSSRLNDSPLVAVGSLIQRNLTMAWEYCSSDPIQLKALASSLRGILNELPQSFGDRFDFDSLLIRAVSAEWRKGTVNLSDMVIPKAADQWGHQTVPLFCLSPGSVPHVELIHFPGEDDLESVDLLDYPFLIHELGHNALSKYGDKFVEHFENALNIYLNHLRKLSVSDKGMAKARATRISGAIDNYWRPTPDHFNWAHEIAVDLIGLWTCGPAYLGAFQDVVESPQLDPFKISQSHPPYDARVEALTYAARRLGWDEEAIPLTNRLHKWRGFNSRRTNEHAAFCDRKLIESCAESALACCDDLRLPRCDRRLFNYVRSQITKDETPEMGIELLLGAWHAWQQMDESDFIHWERKVIERLLND